MELLCRPVSKAAAFLLQVSEAEEEEQMQVDSIKQQELQLAEAKKAAGLARWRRLQVSTCAQRLVDTFLLCVLRCSGNADLPVGILTCLHCSSDLPCVLR